MDRRMALAAFASVPLIGAGLGRPGMSDVDELAGELERIERASVTEPPWRTLDAGTDAYTRASGMLTGGRERVAREAAHVAAHVAGRLAALVGNASFGVGDYRAARSWFTHARHRAFFAGDVDTTAWIFARESAVPYYYAAYPTDVGGLVERGLSFLPERSRASHPAASLLLLRAAEAYARDGHEREARSAVDAAERIDPGPAGSRLRLGLGEQTRSAARVFTELGDVNEADARHQVAAGEQRGTTEKASLALDRARCLARARQVDAAAVVGLDAWSRLPRQFRNVPARYTARRLSMELRPWRGQRHVDAYLEVISGGV